MLSSLISQGVIRHNIFHHCDTIDIIRFGQTCQSFHRLISSVEFWHRLQHCPASTTSVRSLQIDHQLARNKSLEPLTGATLAYLALSNNTTRHNIDPADLPSDNFFNRRYVTERIFIPQHLLEASEHNDSSNGLCLHLNRSGVIYIYGSNDDNKAPHLLGEMHGRYRHMQCYCSSHNPEIYYVLLLTDTHILLDSKTKIIVADNVDNFIIDLNGNVFYISRDHTVYILPLIKIGCRYQLRKETAFLISRITMRKVIRLPQDHIIFLSMDGIVYLYDNNLRRVSDPSPLIDIIAIHPYYVIGHINLAGKFGMKEFGELNGDYRVRYSKPLTGQTIRHIVSWNRCEDTPGAAYLWC